MKKFFIFILIGIIIIGGGFGYYLFYEYPSALPTFVNESSSDSKYIIKRAGIVVDGADTLDEAVNKASKLKRGIAINTFNNEWIYSNLKPYLTITSDTIHDFDTFIDAYSYAKKNDINKIYYKNGSNVMWEKQQRKSMANPLSVPLILQLPELPRGCEVTSLAMLFKHAGKDISKMQLAKEVKKDTTPYSKDARGRITYGNPYDGFVGDMYNSKKEGYAVYHGPIAELATKYFDSRVIDLTGIDFEDMLYFVAKGYPIWIVTNATYDILPDNWFEIWHTPTGIVKITRRQHSVVITGYDEQYIYINDPLYGQPNRKIPRSKFKAAWEQMGNQAIIIANHK